MSIAVCFVLVAVIGYLLGSLNSAIVVSKLFLHKDIRTMGSGNAGLTNANRCMGGKYTLMVLAGDILKTVIAVLIARAVFGLYPDMIPVGKLVCGLFVVAGHMFPVYFGFKGGKGVLSAAALGLMHNWPIFTVLAIVFFLLVLLTRYVSLGSVVIALAFPFMNLWYYWGTPSCVPVFILTAIIGFGVVYMHRANIGRLLHGTESKLSFHKKSA